MGRKSGITTLHIIVLSALALVAIVSLITYTNLAHVSLQFGRRATPARAARRPLVELALAGAEIQDTLAISSPLTLKSSTRRCEIPRSIECFRAEYASSAGDLVSLLLTRFTVGQDAVNFGLRMKYQVDQDQKATEIIVRVSPEELRWLDRTDAAGVSAYHGGANESTIAMYVTWQPASVLSDDEAAMMFSNLLRAQFEKFEPP